MRINLTLTLEEEKVLLEAIEHSQSQGFPITPTGIVHALFWAGVHKYQAEGKLSEQLHQYFSEIGRKGGRASRGTSAAKIRAQTAGKESAFQRLFRVFLTQNTLVDALMKEYPGAIDRCETEEELEEWLEKTFRARSDYQDKVKALLSSKPQLDEDLTHQPNGE